jgi:tetratricopeptide (TPR) repeat protein
MKRAGLVSKGTMNRLRTQVQQAWANRDLPKCVELLERVIRMNPADTWALLQIGRIHGLLYNYAEATEYFEKAYKLSPADKKAQTLTDAGQQARDFYDPSFSEDYFQRAVREEGATADMFVKAAEVAEHNRRMEDAHALVQRALMLEPRSANAFYMVAHLHRREGHLEKAEAGLRPLLEISIDPEIRVRAWYELGAVLDRQKRYDEAMKAFLQAKALLRYKGGPLMEQRRVLLQRYATFRDQLTELLLKKWMAVGEELDPKHKVTLLGGHPRSGTTLLEQVLDSHPDVVSMEESDTFGTYVGMPLTRRKSLDAPLMQVYDSIPADLLSILRQDYIRASEGCVGGALNGRMLVDKHPSLTLSIPALIRAFPEIHLLIALRDPRDVVLSCFMQPFLPLAVGNAAFLSFDTAVQEYAGIMGMWLKLRSIVPNAHLEVHYEDMVEDLESVARPVLDFLQVPWDPTVLGFDEHASKKRVRSPTYADVTQKVFKRARGRWRNYEKHLAPHLSKLEPFLKAFGYE